MSFIPEEHDEPVAETSKPAGKSGGSGGILSKITETAKKINPATSKAEPEEENESMPDEGYGREYATSPYSLARKLQEPVAQPASDDQEQE